MFVKLQYEDEELEELLNDDNYSTITATLDGTNERLEVLVDQETLDLYESNIESLDLECVVVYNSNNSDIKVGEGMYLDLVKVNWNGASLDEDFSSTIAIVRKII